MPSVRWDVVGFTTFACALAALVEGLAAGRNVKRRLGELRLPRFSPPLFAWLLIGVSYYAIVGVALYRLLILPESGTRRVGLILVTLLLGINALWNYLFFQRQSPRASFHLGLPYSALAVLLCVVLFKLDAVGGWVFVPYVVYLLYANGWTYLVWRLNRSAASVRHSI
jgi:benzodiazapine receptor